MSGGAARKRTMGRGQRRTGFAHRRADRTGRYGRLVAADDDVVGCHALYVEGVGHGGTVARIGIAGSVHGEDAGGAVHLAVTAQRVSIVALERARRVGQHARLTACVRRETLDELTDRGDGAGSLGDHAVAHVRIVLFVALGAGRGPELARRSHVVDRVAKRRAPTACRVVTRLAALGERDVVKGRIDHDAGVVGVAPVRVDERKSSTLLALEHPGRARPAVQNPVPRGGISRLAT